MDIYVLDDHFNSLYNIDVFESLIWTERYNGCGNFEFYTPVNQTILDVVAVIQAKMEQRLDCYVWAKESESVMIIEDLEITTDAETGTRLIMSGRSLESILERRIIWTQTSLNGNLQECVKKLINDAIINPSMKDRRIPNFLFEKSKDERIETLKIRAQYTGDNLYDTILSICDTYELGFDVRLDQNNNFVFLFTIGENRSYDQDKNPYVIFSPSYENIVNSDYLESVKTLKNVTLVAGEGQGSSRKTFIVGSGTGLSRRELYTDARDIQSEPYSQQLDEDKEALAAFKQQVEDDKQSLSEAKDEAEKETEEHIKTISEYESLERDYANRILSLKRRIDYYQDKIANYKSSLSSSQESSFELRETYKQQIESYDKAINSCTNKINSCNDKLRNERALTYDKIVEYEETIDAEEKKKSEYEDEKKPIEQSKSETEESLPDYEDTLYDYEQKISKYEGIIANDEESLNNVRKEHEKEEDEYSKKIDEYSDLFNAYKERIAEYESKSKMYEARIIEDEKALNELYDALLKQRGEEKLSKTIYTEAFTSEIEAKKMFVYGTHFFKGDVVQIINEYNMEAKARVLEVVRVQDTNGKNMYPTFQIIK